MYHGDRPLLHPALRLERPEVVAGDVLVGGPIRQPLPLPDGNAVIFADLETRREVDYKGEARVLGVGAAGAVLALACTLDGTDGEVGRGVGDLDSLDEFGAGVLGGGDKAEGGGVGEDDGLLEVVREAEVAAGEAEVLEAEAAEGGGQEEELAEAEDGGREGGRDGGGLEAELGGCPRGEAGPEDALHGVIEDVEGVGVAEEEAAGVVRGKAKVAAGEGSQTGDGEGGARVGEDDLLEAEGATDLLLYLHQIVKRVVADTLELPGERRRLGHPPGGGSGGAASGTAAPAAAGG